MWSLLFFVVGSLNFFSEFLKDDENVQMVFLCWCKIRFFCLLEIQLKPVDLPGTLLRPLFKSQIIFPGTDTRQSTGVQWQYFSTAFLAVVHGSGGSVDPEATSLISGPARQLGSGAQPAVQSRGCNLCNLCSDTRDYNLPLTPFSQPIAAARPGPARDGTTGRRPVQLDDLGFTFWDFDK